MTIPRTLTLSILLGAMALGACSRQSGRQVGRAQARSSANVVTQEQIDELNSVSTVEEVLLQLVAGVEGANGAIRFRGMQGSPLIVVNGVPVGFGQIPVTARDVGRIEVLRSGGEIAAYGVRGSNGVIVIETRTE